MLNIYTINEEIRRALQMVDDDGVPTEEGFAQLMSLKAERDEILEGVAIEIKEATANAAALAAEEKRLAKRRSQLVSRVARLTDFLRTHAPGEVVETSRASLRWRRSEQVIITNPDELPREFLRVKTTETPDKVAIREALKRGSVKGAHLEQVNNPQIK